MIARVLGFVRRLPWYIREGYEGAVCGLWWGLYVREMVIAVTRARKEAAKAEKAAAKARLREQRT